MTEVKDIENKLADGIYISKEKTFDDKRKNPSGMFDSKLNHQKIYFGMFLFDFQIFGKYFMRYTVLKQMKKFVVLFVVSNANEF